MNVPWDQDRWEMNNILKNIEKVKKCHYLFIFN